MEINWSGYGILNGPAPLQNGGTCYAHAISGSLTARLKVRYGVDLSASTQQNIDCCLTRCGSEKGSIVRCLAAIRMYGIRLENNYRLREYPLSPRGGCLDCDGVLRGMPLITVGNYEVIYRPTRHELLNALLDGPIALDIFVGGPFDAYQTARDDHILGDGVYEFPENGITLHSVVLMDACIVRGVPCWNVKNCWGPRWGRNGYAKLNQNLTRFFYRVGYPTDLKLRF